MFSEKFENLKNNFKEEKIKCHLVNIWIVKPTRRNIGSAIKKMSREHKISQTRGIPAYKYVYRCYVFKCLWKVNCLNIPIFTLYKYYCNKFDRVFSFGKVTLPYDDLELHRHTPETNKFFV